MEGKALKKYLQQVALVVEITQQLAEKNGFKYRTNTKQVMEELHTREPLKIFQGNIPAEKDAMILQWGYVAREDSKDYIIPSAIVSPLGRFRFDFASRPSDVRSSAENMENDVRAVLSLIHFKEAFQRVDTYSVASGTFGAGSGVTDCVQKIGKEGEELPVISPDQLVKDKIPYHNVWSDEYKKFDAVVKGIDHDAIKKQASQIIASC